MRKSLHVKISLKEKMKPKEENVADYPRPPLIEIVNGSVIVEIGGEVIATDTRYARICETFHPPTIYINPNAFRNGTIHKTTGPTSFCEWKGVASYWNLSMSNGDRQSIRAGWSYSKPSERYQAIKDWISLYPRLVDSCVLEGEPVTAQPGNFYGGWITSWVYGPFKGDPNHPELV